MLKFTICFMKQGDHILLLNREKSSWMGMWNGIGGKLEPNETPRESILREVLEETGIRLQEIQFKGVSTWIVDQQRVGGMYVYVAELPLHYEYATPLMTDEGILDWKSLSWILHKENRGVASHIPGSLEKLLFDPKCYEYCCIYEQGELVRQEIFLMDQSIEEIMDERVIDERIFAKYKIGNGRSQ